MRNVLIIIFSLILFLSIPSTAKAANYYIDSSCSVNGNGTTQACGTNGPFNSLANAQNAVTGNQSDSNLLLKAGQTFSGQYTVSAYGTSGHPFTISSYGTGSKPVISGGGANIMINCANCKYITIDGLELSTSTGTWSANIYINYPAANITVKNNYIHNSPYRGILVLNSSNNIIDSNEISQNNGSGAHAVEILKFGSTPQPTVGNVVRNNKIHNNLGYGIAIDGQCPNNHLDGSATKFYGNEIYNNSTGTYIVCADGVEVYNNNYHDNGKNCKATNDCTGETYGLALEGTLNVNAHDNIISNSYNTGIGVYGDNGVTSGPANSNSIYRNVVYGTQMGVWQRDIDWECYVGQSVGSNNKVYNNIFYGSGVNFSIADNDPSTSGNVAYNNVFYGGSSGVVIERSNSNAGWTFKNNIMAGNSTYSVKATGATGGLTLLNNIYFKPSGGTLVVYNNASYSSTNIKNIDANARLTDPKFVGTTTWSDLRLQSTSPAIDAGLNLGTPYNAAHDPNDTVWPLSTADQNSFGSAWEIGPFVYKSATTPQPTSTVKPGDANGDGLVNEQDYDFWSCNYLKKLNCLYNADFNYDGRVDGIDYTIWLLNFGK